MLKRAQDAEEKWRGAQALIEQIKITFSEKEKELENTLENLKRQQEGELFKLNQENYILQAKVPNVLFCFSFLFIKKISKIKSTMLPFKFLVSLVPGAVRLDAFAIYNTDLVLGSLQSELKSNVAHFDDFPVLAVLLKTSQ